MLNEPKFYLSTLSSSGIITKILQGLHTCTLEDKWTKGLHFVICLVKFHVNDHASHNICLIFLHSPKLNWKPAIFICENLPRFSKTYQPNSYILKMLMD